MAGMLAVQLVMALAVARDYDRGNRGMSTPVGPAAPAESRAALPGGGGGAPMTDTTDRSTHSNRPDRSMMVFHAPLSTGPRSRRGLTAPSAADAPCLRGDRLRGHGHQRRRGSAQGRSASSQGTARIRATPRFPVLRELDSAQRPGDEPAHGRRTAVGLLDHAPGAQARRARRRLLPRRVLAHARAAGVGGLRGRLEPAPAGGLGRVQAQPGALLPPLECHVLAGRARAVGLVLGASPGWRLRARPAAAGPGGRIATGLRWAGSAGTTT